VAGTVGVVPLPDLTDRDVLTRLVGPLDIDVLSDPEPIGDAYGFASARAAVIVSVRGGEPTDVVIKVWDAADHGLGEIEFYAEWASRLPVRLPTCHALDATDDMGMLVLEDLRPFRQGDELEAVDVADACSIARVVARVHASTVGADGALPPPRFGRALPPEWHDTRRVAYIERFGMPDHALVRAIVMHSQVAEQVGRALWMDAAEGLTHSDIHLDNVVFRDEEPVLIDWARPGWGPAAHDLSSVLYSCTAIEDYDEVIEAHRAITGTNDDQVDGAMLKRLVIATLGTARWLPSTPRQERLVEQNLRRIIDVADWLDARRPTLTDLLTG
jgi:Ser/Thr protein kinase RdoA (MazF antagonist)